MRAFVYLTGSHDGHTHTRMHAHIHTRTITYAEVAELQGQLERERRGARALAAEKAAAEERLTAAQV